MPEEAAPVSVPEPSEKAVRYHRGGNVIWVAQQILGIAIPCLLLFSGWSAWLRTFASDVAAGRFYPTLVIYFALLSLLLFLIDLPMSYAVEYARERAYGLSEQRFGKWAGDKMKGLVVGIIVGALLLWVPYWLLAKSPDRWWIWTGALALPFFTLVLLVVPVWIAPLFNKFAAMKDKALEAEVLDVAGRAGIESARVYEVAKSVDTKKVNAYVTGIGRTKRVVLWDTLLARLTPPQIRFVVAHEAGHYVLGHVRRSILVSTVLTWIGLASVHATSGVLLDRFGETFGFHRLADVASMPLLMLLLSVFSLVITPAALALSRHHERQADQFGLELTGDRQSAATAFIALQEQNLAVPRPGRLYKFWRASHPPIGERVDFINGYRPTVADPRPS